MKNKMDERTIKILLVEDDEDDYILARDLLSDIQRLRFELDWVCTYDEALATISRTEYDIFLVDYRLGEQTGLDVLHAILDNDIYTPVIMFTGQDDIDLDIQAMHSGATDYLVKSDITPEMLGRSIRYALERQRSEKALRRSHAELEKKNREISENREKLQSTIDLISSLITRVAENKEFNVRYENPYLKKCCEIMQCNQTDCICYKKEATRCWQLYQQTICNDAQPIFEGSHGHCLECRMFQEATADPIYRIGEQFNNMMYFLELKNKELLEAFRKLKESQVQILQREKMASLGQLAAGVAHEINNPMGFITSNLGSLQKYVDKLIGHINSQSEILASLDAGDHVKELRKKDKIDFLIEDVNDLIDESLDGSRRVSEIVKNLKKFTRLDEAKITETDINECLDDTLKIIWNELKHKVTIHKEYMELPLTFCNSQELNQVFMNLLLNASQSIEDKGDITIRTWAKGGFINVSITDTGQGIAKDIIDKIFEPFFTTKEVGKGTGLGLSICYDIINKHEGKMMFESEIGMGATFTVSVPVKGKEP